MRESQYGIMRVWVSIEAIAWFFVWDFRTAMACVRRMCCWHFHIHKM